MENNKRRKRTKSKKEPSEEHNYLPVGEVPPGTVLGYPQEESPKLYKNEYGGKLPIGSMK
jgi:hypothetical protein